MSAVAGTTSAPAAPFRDARAIFVGLSVLFLGLKLIHLTAANVFMDEAYYWLWGQHPALSYFDHPPFNAWAQAVAALALGWNRLALRAMVALALAGDIAVLYVFSRRLLGARWAQHFWPTLLLFLSTPIFFAVTGLAIPDHWLTFFCLLALYGFVSFLLSVDAGAARLRWLYLGAAALGLAALCKYNAVLLGLGFALTLVLIPRYRMLWRNPHLYLAALLALVLQAPVLVWNAQQGFASFAFILAGRHAGLAAPTSSGVLGYVLGIVAFLSPFGVFAAVRLLLERRARLPGLDLARVLLVLSTTTLLAASFLTDILFHWNIVAYVAALPFLAHWFRSSWLWAGHLIYGVLFVGIVLVNYSVLPVMGLVSYADETSAWAYGWPETAAAVTDAAEENGAAFIAATDYTLASTLAFALRNPDVTSLSARLDQFDYWLASPPPVGRSAIVVADRFRPLTKAMRARFKSIKRLKTLQISRFGVAIDSYDIYLARGFKT